MSNDLITCLAPLLARSLVSATTAAQQKSYVTYTAPLCAFGAPEVTLFEARSLLGSSGITGLRTWEAALFLGTYFFSPAARHFVRNKNILELGAGTGFLSILCAKHLGAKYVLATDGSRETLADLELNLSLNGLEGAEIIETSFLKWGQMLDGDLLKAHDEIHPFDLIIGVDVVRVDQRLIKYIFLSFNRIYYLFNRSSL